MTEETPLIYEAPPARLERWLEDHGQPSYRLKQLLDWLYKRFALSFDEMTNLPADLREALAEDFRPGTLKLEARQDSDDGMTVKFAFRLQDDAVIEAVLMRTDKRSTFCISSQVGCAMGCSFCATGQMGLRRNLTAGEMLAQVAELAHADGDEAGNVVFMGMGEPLANLGNLCAALEALTDERRFAIGSRRITVSTVGLPDPIRELSRLPSPPNLALSLNSPFASHRSRLMPQAGRENLGEVIEACREYYERTGRRVMIEYVLLGGENTGVEFARGVLSAARKLGALVNLIPYNPVEGAPHDKPTQAEVAGFREVLSSAGMNVSQRYRRGRDIDAACGQLAGKSASPPDEES
jgi:23S rRNA (adenine2503-C2)-methyltransferase